MKGTLRKKIGELVSILRSEDVDEIELRNWWTTVRVVRRRPEPTASVAHERDRITASGDSAASETAAGFVEEADRPVHAEMVSPPAGENATAAVGEPQGADVRFDKIVSPMVGTFYRAPAPDSEPFVSVGDRVEVGEVLCIIEAMKLMNEIEADRDGVIKKVLVQDNQPVEYGQPLFLVESA